MRRLVPWAEYTMVGVRAPDCPPHSLSPFPACSWLICSCACALHIQPSLASCKGCVHNFQPGCTFTPRRQLGKMAAKGACMALAKPHMYSLQLFREAFPIRTPCSQLPWVAVKGLCLSRAAHVPIAAIQGIWLLRAHVQLLSGHACVFQSTGCEGCKHNPHVQSVCALCMKTS